MPTTSESQETAKSLPVDASASEEPTLPELSAEVVESSVPFVGRWNRLVSTTNWEKGRIISEWRAELETSEAAVTEYSDEAWSRLVGHVTSQHVGRLRRVHDRFGAAREEYEGLFWSHFQAAIDWDDAEMWLEGAITGDWSVSQMRAARWEAVGAPDGVRPTDAEVIEAELDEDSYASLTDEPGAARGDAKDGAARETAGERDDSEESDLSDTESASGEAGDHDGPAPQSEPRVRPFENLSELPEDVAEAFEQFKLVILSHKLTGWEAISCDELLASLDALKALAVAPSPEE